MVDPKKGHAIDYTGITYMTPNLEEALAIAGLEYDGEYNKEKVLEAGKIITDKWGMRGTLITLGEHGMNLIEKNGNSFAIPTMAREVYDVSGAGDTVVGVFAAALCTGAAMKEAAFIANIASGIVVGKVGTAVAELKEIEDAIRGLNK